MLEKREPIAADIGRPTTLDIAFGPAFRPNDVSELEFTTRPLSLQKLNAETAASLEAYMSCAAELRVPRVIHEVSPILWIVDEVGDLWFSLEEVINRADRRYVYPLRRGFALPREHAKLGHPSLIEGARARIGGELLFDEDAEGGPWVITNKSGRYGFGPDRTESHLRKVVEVFRRHNIRVGSIYINPPVASKHGA